MSSSITLQGFNTVLEQEGTELTLIPPDRPIHWDVPYWWYHLTTVYAACARVDLTGVRGNYEVYIAASTNDMLLRIDYYSDLLAIEFDKFNECRYATRILIVEAGALPAVIAGSTEYNDYEYVDRTGWVQRIDGLLEPTIPLSNTGKVKIESTLEIGSTIDCTESPVWSGGIKPYNYQYKWQHKLDGASNWIPAIWNSNWDGITENVPPFLIDSTSLVGHVFQLGLRVRDSSDPSVTNSRFGNIVGPVESPPEPLAIAENGGANWPAGNEFKVGQTVTALTAAFTGGQEPIDYKYAWEIKGEGDSAWQSLGWVSTTNAKNDVTYLIPDGVVLLRLVSEATDANEVEVNSYTGQKDIIQPLVIVDDAMISGVPVVGTTVTCSDPVMTGGDNPQIVTYMLTDYDSASYEGPINVPQTIVYGTNTATVLEYDLDKWLGFLLLIREDDGTETWTQTANRIGPVVQPTTIGSVTIEPASASGSQDETLNFSAAYDGDATDVIYYWNIRSGEATITGDVDGQGVSVLVNGASGAVQVQCSLTSAYSSDSPQAGLASIVIL